MSAKRRPRRHVPPAPPAPPQPETPPPTLVHLNINTVISSLVLCLLCFVAKVIYEDHGSLALLSDRFVMRAEQTDRNFASINAELAAIRTKQASLDIEITKLRTSTPTK